MATESLAERVAKIRWEHMIDLGNGVITPGRESLEWQAWKCRCLPNDLTGKTVLDVGAWDGFYSFEAMNRGAKGVLAMDNYQNPAVCSRNGFDLTRETRYRGGEPIELFVGDIEKDDPVSYVNKIWGPYTQGGMNPEIFKRFDVTIFFGVLYHLRNPIGTLERLYSITQEVVCLESHIRDFRGQPVCYAYAPGESGGDPYTYWGPSPEWIERVARRVGFRVEPLDIRGDRFIARLWKP